MHVLDQHLLTPAQVALRLKVTPASVRRWIAQGELAAVRLGAGELSPIRVPVEAVDRFVRRTGASQEPQP